MNQILTGALAGAGAAAVLAAGPLILQHFRWQAALIPPQSSVAGTQSDAGPPSGALAKAAEVMRLWAAAKAAGDSQEEAELRAAETVRSLTAEECRATAEAFLKSGDQPHALFPDLVWRWATLDGRAAIAWLESHRDLQDSLMDDAFQAWAGMDPSGYAAWLSGFRRELETGGSYSHYQSSHWLARYDLPAAVRITVEKVRNARIDQMYINRMDLVPLIRTPAAAEALAAEIARHPEWLDRVPEEKPLYLLQALRQCWQDLDPSGWDRWAQAHPALAERSDNQPVSPAVAFIRSVNPETTAREMLENAPPDQRAEVINGLVHLWVEDDLHAAGKWLSTLPEDPDKWEAVRTFALAAVHDDPAAALQWAASIGETPRRITACRQVFTRWADTDPAAAADWLPQSGWSGSQLRDAEDILASGRQLKP